MVNGIRFVVVGVVFVLFFLCLFGGCVERQRYGCVDVDSLLVGHWKGKDVRVLLEDDGTGFVKVNGFSSDFIYFVLNNSSIRVEDNLYGSYVVDYNFTENDSLYVSCDFFSKNLVRV